MKLVREKDRIFNLYQRHFSIIRYNDVSEVVQKDGNILLFNTNYSIDDIDFILKIFKRYNVKYTKENQLIEVNYKDINFLVKNIYLY
jgi:hypothetical protein